MNNWIQFFGLMRLGLLLGNIHEPGLQGNLARNGMILVLLSGNNERKDGCSGALFMALLPLMFLVVVAWNRGGVIVELLLTLTALSRGAQFVYRLPYQNL